MRPPATLLLLSSNSTRHLRILPILLLAGCTAIGSSSAPPDSVESPDSGVTSGDAGAPNEEPPTLYADGGRLDSANPGVTNRDAGPPGEERPGFYVEGRHLYDRCGEEVVLRGVNRMTVVIDPSGLPSFPEIARTGANSVRIMWMMWRPAAEAEDAVANALANDLIPILEMHDATGRWDMFDDVVDYWLQPDMLAIIDRHEKDLIVNIANEAGDFSVTDEQFMEGYTTAISRMRDAGIHTPLMIDAAGWGRNEAQLLRLAPDLMARDPDQNLIFSWHPWDPGDQEARITRAMEQSVDLRLPFVIGEFAEPTVGCAGQIPYRHIMAEAERLGIGYLPWSWGPGNADCAGMDMTTNGTFDGLRGWGLEVAVTDPNGIMNTSVRPHSMVTGECRVP